MPSNIVVSDTMAFSSPLAGLSAARHPWSVSCNYFDARQAVCAWPGVEDQIAVIRVIGTIPTGYTASLSSDDESTIADLHENGGGNGDGGFQGPKDSKDAPNEDPKPNWDGPKDFQMAT